MSPLLTLILFAPPEIIQLALSLWTKRAEDQSLFRYQGPKRYEARHFALYQPTNRWLENESLSLLQSAQPSVKHRTVSKNTAIVGGTVFPGAGTIVLYANGSEVGRDTANPDGSYTVSSAHLNSGAYVLKVAQQSLTGGKRVCLELL